MIIFGDGQVGVDDVLRSALPFDSPYSAVVPKDCAIL
jgi:hypothetical protein